MKLLDWIHRKKRQTDTEASKDFTTGKSCAFHLVEPSFSDQQNYPKPSHSYPCPRNPQQDCQRSSSKLRTKSMEEESSIMNFNFFDGFLAIGTLGSQPIIKEPSTPTFPIPYEKKNEKETGMAKKELQLINDETEKFIETEGKNVYSASNRASCAGTITPDSKLIGPDTEECEKMLVCPLQGYLFGSSIKLPETGKQVEKEKMEPGWLFKRNNTGYKYSTEKGGKKNQANGTSATRFMKKMLKKLQPFPRSSEASAGEEVSDYISTKRKLPKVMKMFHKKIHPEGPIAEKVLAVSHNSNNSSISYGGGHNNGDVTIWDKDNILPSIATSKKEATNLKTHTRLSNGGSTQSREHWIKTDADYLVLEL